MARAERFARWGVIVLVVVSGVHGVLAARGLYADGAYDLYTMLSGQWLLNDTRAFAVAVTQAPAWLALALGITNVHALAILHSLGVVGAPVALWVISMVLLVRERLFWPMVVVYAVVFLNAGFVAIGQYNLVYGYVAVGVALLVRSRLSVPGAIGLLVVSVLMARTYEGVFYLAPCLAALAIVTWWRRRRSAPRWDSVIRLVSAGILVVAAVLGAIAVIFPDDATNRAGAADVLAGFLIDRQLILSALIGVLLIAARWLPRGLVADLVYCVAIIGTLAFLLPDVWAQPWMHYSARTPAGLMLVVLLGLALVQELWPARVPGAGGATTGGLLRWLAPAVLLVALTIPFTVHTQGFRTWLGTFEQTLAQGDGEVELGTSPVWTAFPTYGWPWTNPMLSVLLRPPGSETQILSPGAEVGSEPIVDIPDRFRP